MARIINFPERDMNPPDEKVAYVCSCCDAEIYQGQDYVEFEGEPFCDEMCVLSILDIRTRTAESEEDYGDW